MKISLTYRCEVDHEAQGPNGGYAMCLSGVHVDGKPLVWNGPEATDLLDKHGIDFEYQYDEGEIFQIGPCSVTGLDEEGLIRTITFNG
jgi:hypothetical protein